MDFIVGLPRTNLHHDSIFVMVDRHTKVAHFILRIVIDDAIIVAHKFMKEFFRLHDFPENIVFDHDNKFISKFYQTLHKELGTKLNFSTTFHPKYDGKNDRFNHILEDILRIYCINNHNNWE